MINGVSERILTREEICSGSSGLEEVDEFRESGRDAMVVLEKHLRP